MLGVGEEGLLSQEVAAAERASATDESDELGRRRVRVSREAERRRVAGRRTIARTTRPSASLLKEVGGGVRLGVRRDDQPQRHFGGAREQDECTHLSKPLVVVCKRGYGGRRDEGDK